MAIARDITARVPRGRLGSAGLPFAIPCLSTAFLAPALLATPPCDSSVSGSAPALLRGGLLIDGSAGPPRPGTDILISGGRIVRIGPTGSFEAPERTRVFDVSGKTVVPGIINLRGLAGLVISPEGQGEPFSRSEILAQLQTYSAYGVTTTTTLGPDSAVLGRLRDEILSGVVRSAARVMTPFRSLALAGTGRGGPSEIDSLIETVRSPPDARHAVDRLADEGADYIELRLGDVDQNAPDRLAVATAAIDRGSQRGLRVAVLAATERTATVAVRAGARAILGSVSDTELSGAFISDLRASGAVFAPALSELSLQFEYGDQATWLDDRYLRRSLPTGVSGLLRGPVHMRQALDPDRALRMIRLDIAKRNLRRIESAGVKIGLASGSGVPGSFAGFAEYREAVLLKRAGMSAASVIRALSTGSAAALGVESERGALKTGYLADLVVLNANPLENIHNLRELHAVFVGGCLSRL